MGEKRGFPYIPDKMALRRAKTVIVVESAINAISAIAAYDPKGKGKVPVTAIATRGLAVDEIDWRFLSGKRVVCCFDNDQPIAEGRRKGQRTGPEAAWIVDERGTAMNMP
uniref:toprim domain-containing protein n=1 Tax=Vibrio vulnificus TaxID=672 RepID=UPI000AFBCF5B